MSWYLMFHRELKRLNRIRGRQRGSGRAESSCKLEYCRLCPIWMVFSEADIIIELWSGVMSIGAGTKLMLA